MKKEETYNAASAAMRALMHEHRNYLSQQTGIQGTCADCQREVARTELGAKCPICRDLICVDCVDAHQPEKHPKVIQ